MAKVSLGCSYTTFHFVVSRHGHTSLKEKEVPWDYNKSHQLLKYCLYWVIRHPCLLLPFSLALFGRAVQSTDRNRFFLFLLHLPPLPHFLSPAACWQQERREKECLVSETVTRNIHAAAAQHMHYCFTCLGDRGGELATHIWQESLIQTCICQLSTFFTDFQYFPPRRMRKHTVARERLGVGANG